MVLNYPHCGASFCEKTACVVVMAGPRWVTSASFLPCAGTNLSCVLAQQSHCLWDRKLPENCTFLGVFCCSRMRNGTFLPCSVKLLMWSKPYICVMLCLMLQKFAGRYPSVFLWVKLPWSNKITSYFQVTLINRVLTLLLQIMAWSALGHGINGFWHKHNC